ncbi:MAG: STAS domain-containing protein [Ruminococcus sp.]|nr:STAS domain-containing protein [Ruminococcus sp.]
MNIEKNMNGTKLTLIPVGRLDTTTSPQFEAEIGDPLNGISELIIDMKKLEYISSAGLRVILKAQKKMNIQGSMKIINVCDSIREVFDVTGFNEIITIE